jgi:hypothetical protein
MVKARRGADAPPPWRTSRAKMLLRQDIVDGTVDESMGPKEVFQMRQEYPAYEYANFANNLKSLRESIKQNRGAVKPVPWQNSRAKMLLRQDIVDGIVNESMEPKEVFQMRHEYPAYEYDNFKTNLTNLLEFIQQSRAKADSDSAALARDRRIRGPPPAQTSNGIPRWHGSDAQRLLKEDANAGLLEECTPMELRATRLEYQAFPKKIFSDHIHQEKRAGIGKSYWMVRRQKLMEAKMG